MSNRKHIHCELYLLVHLEYFASPMCSWCWGFAPVVEKIKAKFIKELDFRLVLAPFRIDTSNSMDQALRDYVLQQWHKVEQTTGQQFDFTFAMRQDFVYDSKLACQAIKAFSIQLPTQELQFLSAIHAAFYTKNADVTNEQILVDLIKPYKINETEFIKDLHSQYVNKNLNKDFDYCEQLKVQGYPTLLGIRDESVSVLAYGFMPYTNLELKINNWVRS